MTANRKTVQIILIFVGLLLILSTYFLYPKIKKSKVVENQIDKNELITKEEKQRGPSLDQIRGKIFS